MTTIAEEHDKLIVYHMLIDETYSRAMLGTRAMNQTYIKVMHVHDEAAPRTPYVMYQSVEDLVLGS